MKLPAGDVPFGTLQQQVSSESSKYTHVILHSPSPPLPPPPPPPPPHPTTTQLITRWSW